MTRILVIVAILAGTPPWAQTPPPAQPPATQPPSSQEPEAQAPLEPTTGVEVLGELMSAVQAVGNKTNSSKLTEYRDLRAGVVVPGVRLSARDRGTGRFISLSGANLTRSDRALFIDAGELGAWNARVDWLEVPHNFSNKAVTPYTSTAPGIFTVPATVPITFKKLATAAADTAGVLASDTLIAAYQATYLAPTPLETQTNTGRFGATWSKWSALSLEAAYARRTKLGSKSTFGPIGDRPPRTLNIQLAEPVDYRTNDLSLALEHQGERYQVRGEYTFSDFANAIDTIQWQNIYTTAAPGDEFDVWDRLVATTGVRPLPPDNRYHDASVSAGIDLPAGSRLNISTGFGRLEQNETLLPYASINSALAVRTLPRSTAEGLINTTSLALDYTISPAPRLNVRAFLRRYDLNNETPSSRWQYVTSDTSNLNGTASYVNKRVSLPFAWDRSNAGAEATWRLPARSSAGLTYELERIGREFREADTSEQTLRATWRTRATKWLSMKARFVSASRDGGEYHNQVTQEGYWYEASEANDFNNPRFSFDNHPDMRRFDVSDRARRQADLTINLTPSAYFTVSGFTRYRRDNFESGVGPSQPLLGTGVAEAQATTPGDQLGRLKAGQLQSGVDLFAEPRVGLTLNAFVNFARGTSFDRSMEFNENNKQNPSTVATAELGPWTRATSQWTADAKDRTWSGGGGARIDIVPERAALVADYTLSLGRVDIAYAGYGVQNFDGTPFPPNHQFAFSTPPTVVEDFHVVNLRLEIPLKAMTFIAGYSFESYEMNDWQQSSDQPWVESVNAPTLLRDTSRTFQWGNRLFNLGTYLAPSYRSHIGTLSFRYRF